jgi:hypothetical protein
METLDLTITTRIAKIILADVSLRLVDKFPVAIECPRFQCLATRANFVSKSRLGRGIIVHRRFLGHCGVHQLNGLCLDKIEDNPAFNGVESQASKIKCVEVIGDFLFEQLFLS